MTKPMEKGGSFMQMEMFIKEFDWTTRRMGEGRILTWTEQSTLEIGKMTNSMALVLKPGLILLDMKENILTVKNMDLGSFIELMGACLMDNFMITTQTDMEAIPGMTGDSTSDNGQTTKCTDMGSSLGRMAGVMKANMQTTRNKDTEYSIDKMAGSTKGNDIMESNTERECI